MIRKIMVNWTMRIATIGFCLLISLGQAEIDKYTNQSMLSFKGQADPNVLVDIFVNGKVVKSIHSDSEGAWLATEIPLKKEGLNKIYAIARDEYGVKSNTSTELNVVLDKVPPQVYQCLLEPKSLRPGDTLKIAVKTDEDVETVTAVMPDNSTESFNYSAQEGLWLKNWVVPRTISGGMYQLLLTLIDKAGNVTQKNSEEIAVDAQASLLISTPEDGAILYNELVPVKGYARNATYVAIDDQRTLLNAQGEFNGMAKLPKPGRNVITVQAVQSGNKVMDKQLQVVRLVTFPDISNHWAKKEIEYLATLGYLEAYPNSTMFYPDNQLTRAELASILVRIKQLPLDELGIPSKFLDVKQSHWAIGYIDAANKYGIVEGYPGNVYRPQNRISRAETAAMMVRFAKFPVIKAESSPDLDVGNKHWALDYIAAFRAAGLTPPTWTDSARFFPNQQLTRAEAAAILARVPEINRQIEELLGKKTNWQYLIDSSYYTGYIANYTQANQGSGEQLNSADNQAEQAQPQSTLILGAVTPREVLSGKDINISVATLVNMKKLKAKAPDGSETILNFDQGTELWNGSWKIPMLTKAGTYTVALIAEDPAGKKYYAVSNEFKIINNLEVAARELKNNKVDQRSTEKTATDNSINLAEQTGEYTYPEFQGGAGTGSTLGAAEPTGYQFIANEKGDSRPLTAKVLTRGRLTELLARAGKLTFARVKSAPADDVGLQHPNVKSIKSAIVTGVVPNLSAHKFYPDKPVTRSELVRVARMLKLSKLSNAIASGKSSLTETEFDSYIKESVK